MLAYVFMRKALFVGALLGAIIPLMGVVVVNRRTSMIGDALSHTSLAGIGVGLLFGFSPIFGAILACVLGALSIEAVRRRFPANGDLATAIVMSTGIGLASLLTDIVPSAARLEDYLFGSIVAIADGEVLLSTGVAILVLSTFFFFYYPLLYISVDPQGARMSGISITRVDFLFTMLLAGTIAISSRIIGVLMVSSLMVSPVACAMVLSKSYGQTVRRSMAFGLFFVLTGLVFSWQFSLKPGGTIVLLGVCTLLILFIFQSLRTRFRYQQGSFSRK